MIRRCVVDDVEFEALRPHAKYCSDRCRKRGLRNPELVTEVPQKGPAPRSSGLEVATRAQLEKVGRVDSLAGQQALIMARNVDAAPMGTTIVSSLMREFRSSLAEAMEGVSVEPDALDRVRSRRDAKLRAV
jgi:hypothetical protein